jgi:carbon monoxide dehydrogenase subunit G
MIVVERKRSLPVAADRVRGVLADIDQLHLLLPRVERVEVLARSDARARVALQVRLGRLGTQRIEGEARLLDDGYASSPFSRWKSMRAGGCCHTRAGAMSWHGWRWSFPGAGRV